MVKLTYNKKPGLKVWLFFSLLFITSCGSITKREEFIQIDSSPRGVEVFSEKNTPLGFTPLIINSPQKRKNYYLFGSDKKKQVYRCLPDWSHSLLPALIIAPVAIPTSLVLATTSLAVDWYTDNLYQCEETIHYKAVKTDDLDKKEKKILILPIYNGQSYNIEQKIKEMRFKNNLTVIDYQDSLKAFSEYGINEDKKWRLTGIRKSALLSVAKKLNATYIMVLNKDQKEHFHMEIHDIFNGQQLRISKSIKASEINSDYAFEKTARRYLYFLPNSVALGTYNTKLSGAEKIEGENFKTKKHPDDFHWLIGMWSLSHVSSPHLYNTWDWDASISPQISFPSYRVELADGKYFQAQNSNFTIDGWLTGHTNIGAFSVGAGAGMTYSYGEDDEGKTYKNFSPLIHIGFSYSAFFSRRVFMKLSVDTYGATDGTINYAGYYFNSTTSSMLSIGYYFPEVYQFFR